MSWKWFGVPVPSDGAKNIVPSLIKKNDDFYNYYPREQFDAEWGDWNGRQIIFFLFLKNEIFQYVAFSKINQTNKQTNKQTNNNSWSGWPLGFARPGEIFPDLVCR